MTNDDDALDVGPNDALLLFRENGEVFIKLPEKNKGLKVNSPMWWALVFKKLMTSEDYAEDMAKLRKKFNDELFPNNVEGIRM